jgi:hypothetical protein
VKENNVEEYVKISLDRYNDLLDDNKKANLLYDLYKGIINIVDKDSFNMDREIDKEIFKIYERLCDEI